jgi:NTE family protein
VAARSGRSREPVALVLAGGGARGAYEVGALSALLPQLRADERPRIIIGTSVGAINAAYLAANADKPPDQLAAGAVELWRGISYGRVLRPLLSLSEAARGLSYAREVLGSRAAHTTSLLDPGPLTSTLADLIAFEQIHANVEAGHIDSAAVVATSGLTNVSVVFHDGAPTPPTDRARGIVYTEAKIEEGHVRASAAIPLFFPAVPLSDDHEQRWYFDGGTRLNTPIKPALALGARRVIVIALNSLESSEETRHERRPDALDGATQLIQAVLVDPLVNDVHTLATINEMLADSSEAKVKAHERRTQRRRVPYMLIAPEDPHEIGRVAADVYRRHYKSPLAAVRSPNLGALGHLVNAGRGASRGELLSYLFFGKEFIEELIEMGRRDADRWLRDSSHDDEPWQLGPLA